MKFKMLIPVVIAVLLSTAITYSIMKSQKPSAVVAEAEEHGHEGEQHEGEEHEGEKMEIAGIKTVPAVAGEGWDALAVTGKVNIPPDRLVKVGPRIEGRVVSANATVGDIVRRGQVLAVISSVDLAEARSQYRQAVSKMQAASRNYQQELQVAKLGANSVRPVEEAKADKLEALGELTDAKSEVLQARSVQSQEDSELAQCKARLERAKELYADKIVSRQDLETAQAEFEKDSAAADAARLRVKQAEARVEKAKGKVDIASEYMSREEKIYKGKLVDTRAVQSAKSELAMAKIDVQAAADRIRVLGANPHGSGETISVVAPITGRVVSRDTNVGQMASTSDTLYTIANLSTVWVEANVHEKDLAKIRMGQRAEITVDAYPDTVFAGKIDSIGDILSPDSRTAKVRCTVSNTQGLLKAEMFAKVSLITAHRGSTVLIPKEAVLDDAGKKCVYTPCMDCPEDIKAGTNACGAYDKLNVVVGPIHGNKIEILSGVEPGTDIVTEGAYQLKTALGSGQLEAGCTDH